MLSRVFLAAGVAALAIAAPASAGPGGGHGGGGGNPHNGGGGAPAFSPPGGGGGGHGRGGGGGGPAFAQPGGGGHGHGGGGFAAPQMQRVERQQFRAPQMQRVERQQFRAPQMRAQRQEFRAPQMRAQRQQLRGPQAQQVQRQAREQSRGFARQQERLAQQAQHGNALRQQERFNQQAQRGSAFRQQQVQNGFAQRGGEQGQRLAQVQQRLMANNPVAADRLASFRNAQTSFAGNGTRGLIDGCPPGLWMKNNGCMPPGQAAKLLGAPLAAASAAYPLSVLPQQLSYLYPDTPDYYYRYGDGYLYQVDRGSNLIASLLPLIGGGYVPGQYLPQPYMASYVPDYYGLNSFYPDYGDICNRYADGVIYEVDCATGYVEDVIPIYAGGYGVGQMLPSAYGYYNVPMQYRTMYYDTPDYGYWYAPGAIYQYDQRTSLITSVASLLSPGFTVGQPLPLGYDVYNVPYDYRATYYDTPNAWYRYNNGYIYQVDPATQIVTAIVASLLT